jgi:hypothetical protein
MVLCPAVLLGHTSVLDSSAKLRKCEYCRIDRPCSTVCLRSRQPCAISVQCVCCCNRPVLLSRSMFGVRYRLYAQLLGITYLRWAGLAAVLCTLDTAEILRDCTAAQHVPAYRARRIEILIFDGGNCVAPLIYDLLETRTFSSK